MIAWKYWRWASLAAILIGLYVPLLSGHVPAFRDSYHFYYPQVVWLDDQAALGHYFPQFNPLDGTGLNLVGETSTGLFYPGRVLSWLPGLSVAQRFGLMLLAHTLLTAAGAKYAARRMGLSEAAQWLAAISYSLSGPVFFQHTNPIYLIGAAWLPWALAEAWVVATTSLKLTPLQSTPLQSPSLQSTPLQSTHLQPRWLLWSAATSMMLLGGDPQSTMNSGIVTLVAVGLAGWRSRSLRTFCRRVAQLGLAVMIVVGLTAIQVVPAWHWLQQTRQTVTVEACMSQAALTRDAVPELLRPSEATELNDIPSRGSRYAYSVAPWHLLSLFWTTAGGHFLPENTRALAGLAAEPRMWTASLGIGLLSCLLAVGTCRQSGWQLRTGFWWLVALLAGGAMLGNYTPVWLAHQVFRLLGAQGLVDALPGDESWGVYWLLTKIIPGYEAFRYPGKWSVCFACALSMCAAVGFENRFCGEQSSDPHGLYRNHRPTGLWLILLGSIVALVGVLCVNLTESLRNSWQVWLQHAPSDPWLGAVNPTAALHAVMLSLLLTIGWCVLSLVAIKRLPKRLCAWAIVLLVSAELVVADSQWLVSIKAPLTEKTERIKEPFVRSWSSIGHANFEHQVGKLPSQSPASHLELVASFQQQATLGKLHLVRSDMANLSAFASLTPYALADVRHRLALRDDLRTNDEQLLQALSWLGVEQRLTIADQFHWQRVPDSEPIITLAQPVNNTLHINYFSCDRIELDLESQPDNRLIVRLLQDGGWTAVLENDAGERHRIKPTVSHLGVFQSVDIPAGKWHVRLSYQAPGLWLGAIVTLLTLLVVAYGVLRHVSALHRVALQLYFARSTNTTIDGFPTGAK